MGSCVPSTPAAPGPCVHDSDCPTGESCDRDQGHCLAPQGAASSTAGSEAPSASGGAPTQTGSTAGAGPTGSGSGACACDRDLSQVPVGNPCQSDADCGPNGVCEPPLDLSNGASPTVWTGGYCTAIDCNSSCECPQGSECFFYPDGGTPDDYSLCLADCGTAACRRPGYTCGSVGDPMLACLPECSRDADCGPNLVCDNGTCAPPCQSDSDCGLTEVCGAGHCQAGPPMSCCDCEPCPRGLACVNSECVVSCKADADCPIGERCGPTDVCG